MTDEKEKIRADEDAGETGQGTGQGTGPKTRLQEKLEKLKLQSVADWNDPVFLEKTREWGKELREAIGASDALDIRSGVVEPMPMNEDQIGFMPTPLTRTSPFFPIRRNDLKKPDERDFIEWSTAWGSVKIQGPKLSIFDQTVFYNLLTLVNRYRTNNVLTTQHELCMIAGVTPGKNTYEAIWKSIKRIGDIRIDLKVNRSKPEDPPKRGRTLFGYLIMLGEQADMDGPPNTPVPYDKRLRIAFNPYFLEMLMLNLVTRINLPFRSGLSGDVAKALYTFFSSHREQKPLHIKTLARAVNVDQELPGFKIKERIVLALKELQAKGYLEKFTIGKDDIVRVVVSKNPVAPVS